MRAIFEEEYKLQKWLDVEAAVAQAQASVGDIPKQAAREIVRKASTKFVTLKRVKEIENETRHDLMSMVMALTEVCDGEGRRYVHYGLTSSDIEDTALGVQFKEAFDLLEASLGRLEKTLRRVITERRRLVMVGRTHGRHAGVITFGLKLAVWLAEIKRHQYRLDQVRERALVGKVLGIVGTGAALGKNALKIQNQALRTLGLKPAGLVTQVIQRDVHAEVVFCLGLLGASLEKFAVEIRNLQRSEIGEVLEPFDRVGQVGSSALPSKRNPILSERISSLARLLRGLVVSSMENVPLWHERDLSNSANERFLFPMSYILTDEMLRLLDEILEGIEVHPERMRTNLNLSQGYFLAERVVNSLVAKGVSRQEAHETLRRLSIDSSERGVPLLKALRGNQLISSKISQKEMKSLLDPNSYLGSTQELIEMSLAR
jgi:adenylosuccinate lyase